MQIKNYKISHAVMTLFCIIFAACVSETDAADRIHELANIMEAPEWTCREAKYHLKRTDANTEGFGTDVTYNLSVEKTAEGGSKTQRNIRDFLLTSLRARKSPVIADVSAEPNILYCCDNTATLRAGVTPGRNDPDISRVWAQIYAPGLSEPAEIELEDADGDGIYENVYEGFTTSGDYIILILASDSLGESYEQTAVTVTCSTDAYEEDDSFDQAGVILVNDENLQCHNFNDEGDEDWVKFYGISGMHYKIRVKKTYPVYIGIYDTEGYILDNIMMNNDVEYEYFIWECREDDVYYVRVMSEDPYLWGEYTAYEIDIVMPIYLPDKIEGKVTDTVTGEPVKEAGIKAEGNFSNGSVGNLSKDDGTYFIPCSYYEDNDNYTFLITAEVEGYIVFETSLTFEAQTGSLITFDIPMTPLVRGDLNGDGIVNLRDAISALQIMSNSSVLPSVIYKDADVNDDNRLGSEEAIYILRSMSR
ncbi:hypothetical protein QUF80_15680 [Desulfococcaceae bacterium HSG8]|nr:hypothetical protein [Desulfococcaceae bacterium HSG8]